MHALQRLPCFRFVPIKSHHPTGGTEPGRSVFGLQFEGMNKVVVSCRTTPLAKQPSCTVKPSTRCIQGCWLT